MPKQSKPKVNQTSDTVDIASTNVKSKAEVDEAGLETLVRDIMQVPYSKHKATTLIKAWHAQELKRLVEKWPEELIVEDAVVNDRHAMYRTGYNKALSDTKAILTEYIDKIGGNNK